MNYFSRAALAALAGACVTFACPAFAQEAAPADEQVLHLVTANMPRSLDPINIDAQRIINNGFAEPLVHASLDGAKLIPALAKSWELVEPTLWRIELQPNAKFWSGAPVDASAVQASFERHQAENKRAASILRGATFKAVGPTTLEIRTEQPDPAFLFKTVTIAVHNVARVKELGDRYALEADLSGYFKPSEFVPGELVVAEPFDGYWGDQPKLRRLEARFVVDPQTRYLAMQSGEADMDANVQFEQRRAYIRSKDFKFPAVNASNWNIWMNYRNPLLQDVKLREAISLGTDRNEIVDGVMAPFATHSTGHFPAGLPYSIETRQETDPARAMALLDELGWKPGADGIREKDGKRLEFSVLTYGWWQTVAIALEAQWRRIGVATKLHVVEPTASNQIMLDGAFDIATYCSCGTATGDLNGQLSSFYRSDAVQNWQRYASPAVDALIDRLRTEADTEKRFALAREIQEKVMADTALIYVANAELIGIAHAARVAGVDAERPRDITPSMYIAAE
ncbi:MAG: ABC transporter substrate-binding protein [Rhizobiaceae bacterium]